MTCGSCNFTDKLCYCSMPPKVRCIITNEFHYYDDECNCEEAATRRKEVTDELTKKLNKPSPIMAINYDGPNAPSVSFSGEFQEELCNTTPAACTAWGATPCLVCGEDVQLEGWWIAGPKICPTCQKAIKFIKEKFNKELEEYEV